MNELNQKDLITREKAGFYLSQLLSGIPKRFICNSCMIFPCVFPSNLGRRQLYKLENRDILFFEKSDGIRYICLQLESLSLLFNRRLAAYTILNESSNCGSKKMSNNLTKFSLYDGEMVFNEILECFEYLVFDFILFNGDWRLSTWHYNSRIFLAYFLEFNKQLFPFNKIYRPKIKKLYSGTDIKYLFKGIIKNSISNESLYFSLDKINGFYCNKNDGIVLSFSNFSYSFRNASIVLKYKSVKCNTVDFHYLNNSNNKGRENGKRTTSSLLCAGIRSEKMNVHEKYGPGFSFGYTKKKNLSNSGVLEMGFDNINGNWYSLKCRPDKKRPNSFRVVVNTLEILSSKFFPEEVEDCLVKSYIRTKRGKSSNFFKYRVLKLNSSKVCE